MNICYFGTYEETYSRNELMIKGLRALGHNVVECHVSLWGGVTDKSSTLSGFRAKLGFFVRLMTLYPRLFAKYVSIGRRDVIFVGYFGHLDMIIARLFGMVLFRRDRIVFDAFLSLYDSMILDRKMAPTKSLLATLTTWLDTTACNCADVVILDTNHHIDFFHSSFGIPREKMVRVFASADGDVFFPRPSVEQTGRFQVLFYGKYIPLHGIEHIVEAAHILRNDPSIRFKLIGRGQLYPKIRRLASDRQVTNIEFVDWVDYEELPNHIARADVCLGIFAASEKTARVIPNKVFQAMAMGKAVITGRTPGSSEGLVDGENVRLCNVADPQDLALAIKSLKEDSVLRAALGDNARKTFEEIFGDRAVQSSLRLAIDLLPK